MPEAVIVSAARTPIGRANKGSLKDFRPDDLAAFIVKTALDKIPALDPNTVDDLGATRLAQDVVRKIEETLEYPGQIKVTVIRETRSVDYAR